MGTQKETLKAIVDLLKKHGEEISYEEESNKET
jgi:hypothetical protein